MQETWVQSLGWEDTLEKGKATHSNILGWRIPWNHKVTFTCTFCIAARVIYFKVNQTILLTALNN